MAIGTAFRAFWVALMGGPRADLLREALDGKPAQPTLPAPAAPAAPPKPASPPTPARSDAVTLLSALQREARLVDLVKEPLDAYADAQIGAAARPCLKQCAQVLDRMFELSPVTQEAEGEALELPSGWSPQRFQVVGDTAPTPGAKVRIVHPGWQANACKIPQWTGRNDEALIVAAAQVEAAR